MYLNVSNEYISAVNADSRTFQSRLVFSDFTIDSKKISKINLLGGGNEDKQIAVGVAVSQSISVDALAEFENIKGRDFLWEIGLKLPSGEFEYIPMGKYSVKTAKIKGGVTSITAYDNMERANKKYTTKLLYPNTVENITLDICKSLNVPFEENFDFKDYTMATAPPKTQTFREMLGFISALYGKSAVFDRNGVLTFRWFTEADYELSDNRIEVPEKSEGHFVGEYLSVKLADDEYLNMGDEKGEQGYTFENPYMTTGKIEYLWEQIKGFEYDALKINIKLSDPRLDPLDILTYKGLKIPCMKLDFNFDGGLWGKVQSQIASEKEYESPSERKEQAVKNQIKDSNTVISATNGSDVNLGTVEEQITSSNISVGRDSSPYLMFTAQIYADAEADAEFRIKTNASTIMTYYQHIMAGKSIVTFVYPILGLDAGTVQVDVWCIADAECGVLPMLTAKQIIAGQGLTRTEGWNGIIAISNNFSKLIINSNKHPINISTLNAGIYYELLTPSTSQFNSTIPKISIGSSIIKIKGLGAKFSVGEYPYLVNATTNGTNEIVLRFKGHITNDITIDTAQQAFLIGIYPNVYMVHSLELVTSADESGNYTDIILSTDDFSSQQILTVAYNSTIGKLHVEGADGHLVPTFETQIEIGDSDEGTL